MKDKDYFHDIQNSLDFLHEEFFESNSVIDLTSWMTKIAKSRYKKANLEEIVAKCMHLTIEQRNKLYHLLKEHEGLFDGTLGKWNLPPKDIKLKEGAMPYHARPFTVPKLYEQPLRNELDR